jgi:Ca2+-binding EF-hand superfamily protein
MELREIFSLCDGDGTGKLDRRELRKALKGA